MLYIIKYCKIKYRTLGATTTSKKQLCKQQKKFFDLEYFMWIVIINVTKGFYCDWISIFYKLCSNITQSLIGNNP